MKRKLTKRNKQFMSSRFGKYVGDRKWESIYEPTYYKNRYFKDEGFWHLCVWRMHTVWEWQ